LLTSDLTVSSPIEGAAARAGVPLQIVARGEEAIEQCRASDAKLLVVDLSLPSLDISSVVRQISSFERRPKIVAFGPHVHKSRLVAAREAGCDEVLSRGQFLAGLDAIVERATSSSKHQGTAGGG
jgi:CheY-like chemotaxis protein